MFLITQKLLMPEKILGTDTFAPIFPTREKAEAWVALYGQPGAKIIELK